VVKVYRDPRGNGPGAIAAANTGSSAGVVSRAVVSRCVES